MEKAEISRLISSFNAIKGYFDTTQKYMPQIARLVVFIEEIIPLFDTIQDNLKQSSSLIPKASERLGKVTSATEMAATEVMDIVDNVIERLGKMSASVEVIEGNLPTESADVIKKNTDLIREEIDGSQDDLFSIMNALQFQDITTQQINGIGDTIERVHVKIIELLSGFQEEGISLVDVKKSAFDPNAEFDFERSAESQKMADDFLKKGIDVIDVDQKTDELDKAEEFDDKEVILGDDGQPDISAIMNQMKPKKKD
ncbi:protein phosphatase CheZ [Candidatus Latescibacterota bacterium]